MNVKRYNKENQCEDKMGRLCTPNKTKLNLSQNLDAVIALEALSQLEMGFFV